MNLRERLTVRWRALFIWLIISLFYSGVSCTDITSFSRTCSDPIGSENDVINNSVVDVANSVFCFAGPVSDTAKCQFNKCYQLQVNSSLGIIQSVYFEASHCSSAYAGVIADFGAVNCLGDVTSKPSSDQFYYSLEPLLHHGYVVNFQDGTYGRFFIESLTEQSGKITAMNITRQYPF